MANETILTGLPAERTAGQLREHYEIEKELAARLRQASRAERRSLYHPIYDERLRRIPAHPLLTLAQDPLAQARAGAPQLRLVATFLKPESTFLEIGPGDCKVALAVARIARRVFAVDVSDGLIQVRERPANFKFLFSDGISVPVPPGSVDLAYSNQVMEHLHADDGLDQLRNVYTALAPGGAYICITPNRLSGPWDISRGFDEEATGLHLKEYTTGELAQHFYSAGFRQVNVFLSYHGYVLTPLLPVGPFAALERGLSGLPSSIRRKLAGGLTAVKVVGYK